MNLIDIKMLRGLPSDTPDLPKGWLSGLDAAILYTVATAIEGATLEVGSWIGRSSCCLAYGVRDRQRKEVDYDIIDFGIAGIGEWHTRFRSSPLAHKDAKTILEVICFPGGTVSLLKQNLVDRNISHCVRSIFLGDLADYASKRKYDFIFCDATHDAVEIERNIPPIANMLNSERFVLICDDIIDVQNAKLVMKLAGAEEGWLSNLTDSYSKFLVCTKGNYSKLFQGLSTTPDRD